MDLLIDRRDHIINLCEAKFTKQPFSITKAYKTELQRKQFIFTAETQTRKTVLPILVSTYKLHQNEHSLGYIHQNVTMDDLFEDT
ncbi:hypothetical protein [Niabella ginsenosidivorans]|uniref:hypothetical protein n=1 Tax=Niabella ginsenosidivorans TaxID=1176587 RepID=UPI000A04526A|nr:hypothetical protein [Niabella ginsenosidivorans]